MSAFLPGNISGIVGQVLLEKYGSVFRHIETLITVTGLNAVPIVAGDPDRVCLYMINVGTSGTVVAPGNIFAAQSQGIVIFPNGGFLLLTATDDFILPILPWYGRNITGSDLYVLEVKRDTTGNFETL